MQSVCVQRSRSEGGVAISCHPSHEQSKQGIDPRAIDRRFHWKFGHDPNDDDAREDSGWKYINIERVTPALPTDKESLGGGPESGIPCQNIPQGSREICGAMTRIVKEMTVQQMLEQPGVEVQGTPDYTKIDDDDTLLILMCPRCNAAMHWRRRFLPRKV